MNLGIGGLRHPCRLAPSPAKKKFQRHCRHRQLAGSKRHRRPASYLCAASSRVWLMQGAFSRASSVTRTPNGSAKSGQKHCRTSESLTASPKGDALAPTMGEVWQSLATERFTSERACSIPHRVSQTARRLARRFWRHRFWRAVTPDRRGGQEFKVTAVVCFLGG